MADKLRVVVTGMGMRTPIGNTLKDVAEALKAGKSGIPYMPDWEQIDRMRTKVAGVCDIAGEEASISRTFRRSMGRVATLATLAAIDAVDDSGINKGEIASPACGVSFGSTAGSTSEQVVQMGRMIQNQSLAGLPSSAYLKCMSHTCAGNLATLFHCRGPFIASCVACASGSQGIGFGYEAISRGKAPIMVTGGAEEMYFMHAAIFDVLMATSSTYNGRPHETPRPFDAARDGLVVSEGAGCLMLEEYEHARHRGANIYAEILGYWTNSSGMHLTDSDPQSMEECMRAALKDAGVNAEDIEHVSAHATATDSGDTAEAIATHRVFGPKVPVTALKGNTGHTLGASGAIEAIASILMGREGFMSHTLNLAEPDPELPPLNHIMKGPLDRGFSLGVINNFAFGGVNTSLVIRNFLP
ncbi:MAG: beta-ketoacyl-ACP synthase [Deltaproteobacteria bacterium]|nr:beta-ketoacyl-ACP synthase [Deltaproteobacteria bacterium]